MSAIRTRALVKQYKRLTAVDQLTLEIQEGKVTFCGIHGDGI